MAQKKRLADKVDKRRRAKIKVGVLPDGAPDVRWASGRTEQEAAEKRAELQRLASVGQIVNMDITVFGYAKQFVAHIRALGRQPATIDMYRNALNAHILPAIGSRYLRAITPQDLQSILNDMTGASKSLVRQVGQCMTRMFGRAVVDQLIATSPASGLEYPDAPAGERRALTADERAASLAVAAADPDGIILYMLYYLGARKGETLGIQMPDIRWRAQTVRIDKDIDSHDGDRVGKVKSKTSVRWVPIPDPLLGPLKSIDRISGFVVEAARGGRMGSAAFYRTWDRLMHRLAAELGVPRSEVILTPHYYRHNYASILYAAGVPLEVAANWLGHSDINVTRRIYLHFDQQKLAAESVGLLEFFTSRAELIG